MDYLDLVKVRYSVRKFSKRNVSKETLDLILEAGRLAPTAVNYQSQRILVLNTEDSLSKINHCTPYLFGAPMALLVCYDSNSSWKRPFDDKDMGIVDASIVATHMILEIVNLGLGCTWVGHFDPQKVKAAFSLPDNIIPVVLLPVGYPDDTCKPHPNHYLRNRIDSTVFYNSL